MGGTIVSHLQACGFNSWSWLSLCGLSPVTAVPPTDQTCDLLELVPKNYPSEALRRWIYHLFFRYNLFPIGMNDSW